jgi:NAD(P)H dehydrogenase (quinone)
VTDVLFPLLHGTFFYTGMAPLPPLAVHDANHLTDEQYRAAVAGLRRRIADLDATEPIPYRTQNGGDYGEDMVLRPEVARGHTGLGAHVDG